MRKLAIATALAGSLLSVPMSATAAPAADSGNMIGLQTVNGKIAYDFINLWFNEHKPSEAFDRYVSRDRYMNHSMITTKEKQTFESEKIKEAKMTSSAMSFLFKQLIAQGDLVVAHILASDGHSQYGDEMVIFLRIRDGKVVDHWDLHSPLGEDSAVFAGLDRWDAAP